MSLQQNSQIKLQTVSKPVSHS